VRTDTLCPDSATAFTRRTWLAIAVSGPAGLFFNPVNVQAASGHFWDVKPANTWTAEEINELTLKSPWAKQVTAQYRAAYDDPHPQDSRGPGTSGGPGAGECGLMPCANVMPGKVVVIWESAQPIRDAIHSVIPAEFEGRYVISIRGLLGEQTFDRLRTATDLETKGKAPLQPGLIMQRNSSLLFGFSRELLPLDVTDKEVQFTVRTGPELNATLLRATFNPKEMTCRGALAL
jgi:hypothetical protein